MKVTRESFPRLSLVRTLREDGLAYLGPFRSRRHAELVMTALWDAVPIRRCAGTPGNRAGHCSFAQLGVAACPCNGSLSEDDYRPVVERLIDGIERNPALLLDRLQQKMACLASTERFEEAAWVRDRHRALAGALERRRAWQALNRAGTVWAEAPGDGALIERGRLVAAWSAPEPPNLHAALGEQSPEWPQVPSSVEDAEEAHLVWQWLTRSGAVLIDATGPLALPATPIPEPTFAA